MSVGPSGPGWGMFVSWIFIKDKVNVGGCECHVLLRGVVNVGGGERLGW